MLGRVDVGEPSKEPRLAGAYDADLRVHAKITSQIGSDRVVPGG